MKMAPLRASITNEVIATLLHDVYIKTLGTVHNCKAYTLDLQKLQSRLSREGMSFLTKTLPRLGKAFDKALTDKHPLNASDLRLASQKGSKLPRFLGELFNRVLLPDGTNRPDPCVKSVESIRAICYCFYKYQLPYSDEQEQQVIQSFVKAEEELANVTVSLEEIRRCVEHDRTMHAWRKDSVKNAMQFDQTAQMVAVTRKAQDLLLEVFCDFDPEDIIPRHGPGAVSTKEQLWDKYMWTNVSPRIAEKYPIDAFFYASLGHVCDSTKELIALGDRDNSAKVILVPKDSRGPRVISCEPLDNQWIQQGLRRAIVDHVQSARSSKDYNKCGHLARNSYDNPGWSYGAKTLVRHSVHFTNQQSNQFAAFIGSKTGGYATLDLKEASDRVSTALVRLLFPKPLVECLEASRSLSTELPDGQILPLRKFAPMGSATCFPIMALTIWAILAAAAPDADTRESILVYGDDVVVTTAYAADAIKQLESFGLKTNPDKCCIRGLFRESCGVDAFKGYNVTPVKIKTVWSLSRDPGPYAAWVAYANSFYDRGYYTVYERIVEHLHSVYGGLADSDMWPDLPAHCKPCPCLRIVPANMRVQRSRSNQTLQKREWKVWTPHTPVVKYELHGWKRYLRWLSEGGVPSTSLTTRGRDGKLTISSTAASSYTRRDTSMLVQRWR